jgi:hypothetical protein
MEVYLATSDLSAKLVLSCAAAQEEHFGNEERLGKEDRLGKEEAVLCGLASDVSLCSSFVVNLCCGAVL